MTTFNKIMFSCFGICFTLSILFFVRYRFFQNNYDRVIDYSDLEKNLINKRWKEADIETSRLIDLILIKATADKKNFWDNSSPNGKIEGERVTLMSRFNCKDLKVIDGLWTKYSEGYYGFTQQSIIINEFANNIAKDKVDEKNRAHYLIERKKSFSRDLEAYRASEIKSKTNEVIKYYRDEEKMNEIYKIAATPKNNPGLLPSQLWFYKNTKIQLSYPVSMIINYNKKCQNVSVLNVLLDE